MTTAELKNVVKVYGNKTVLDGINLQVHEGEILALLGPNGSGKTTLLKILAFIEAPTKGAVIFQGRMVNFRRSERNRLQSTLVFQRTTMFDASVYDNVTYGLKMRKTPKNLWPEKVKSILRLVKLDGFERRPARKLSGGEQQRVALARALVMKTSLLLLDEPTANLDPKNVSIVEEVISAANRELKTTIVMATHNMFQAKNLPTRVALIDNGRISEVGPPAEIFGHLSQVLAGFAALDNTFIGTAKITDGGTTVIDVGNGVLIESTDRSSGQVSIFINPKDIILSKNRLVSSARNVFEGAVTEISDKGTVARLKVDVGRILVVQITKLSLEEMGLSLGTRVFLAFKASSVRIT